LINETPLDFDFSQSQAPLRPITDDFIGCTFEEEWTALLSFGLQDYAEGGGARVDLCVHSESGRVFGLDVEREGAEVFLYNSDIDRFIRTFLVLDQAFHLPILRAGEIAKRLSEIDPEALENSEWRLLLEFSSDAQDSH
jgi:hypothetical protein